MFADMPCRVHKHFYVSCSSLPYIFSIKIAMLEISQCQHILTFFTHSMWILNYISSIDGVEDVHAPFSNGSPNSVKYSLKFVN